jgi:FHS family L-fucose permease-like MFS transporter
LWLVIAFVKMPKASDADNRLDFSATFSRLLRQPHYVWGVIAQFFYVGAQIGVWSFTIRYVMQELNLNEESAASYYIAALVIFTVSRFICTGLMNYFSPQRLLTILAIAAAVLSFIVMLASGYVGVTALIAISACMSMMFPTIFGLASEGLGEDRKIGGSGLIMAILGGAVITMIQGQVSDSLGSIKLAYIVPMLCFVVISYYAMKKSKPALQKA